MILRQEFLQTTEQADSKYRACQAIGQEEQKSYDTNFHPDLKERIKESEREDDKVCICYRRRCVRPGKGYHGGVLRKALKGKRLSCDHAEI